MDEPFDRPGPTPVKARPDRGSFPRGIRRVDVAEDQNVRARDRESGETTHAAV